MTTTFRLFFAVALATVAAGCDTKPSEDDCHQAIANMRRLLQTDKINVAGDVESAVRRCRGSSNKKSVQCAITAQTVAELSACGLVPGEAAAAQDTKTGNDRAGAPLTPESAAPDQKSTTTTPPAPEPAAPEPAPK